MVARPRITEVKRYSEPGEILLSVTLANEGDARLARGVLAATVIRRGHSESLSSAINSTELAPGQYIRLFVSLPEGAREGRDWVYMEDEGAEFKVAGILRKKLLGWSVD